MILTSGAVAAALNVLTMWAVNRRTTATAEAFMVLPRGADVVSAVASELQHELLMLH
jgi:hypothetical protein